MTIDYYALDRIEFTHKGWRALAFPKLSTRYVAGEGDNPEAFIIGEAPGAQEEIMGRPFVGPAGRILRQLMEFADLRSYPRPLQGTPINCWLTNVVKFRPPKNATPSDDMIRSIRAQLRGEWRAVGYPSLIIPVGKPALSAVTGNYKISILRAAGKCHYYTSKSTGKELAIWPMVHPSYGIRNPAIQPLLEQDWVKLAEWRASGESWNNVAHS